MLGFYLAISILTIIAGIVCFAAVFLANKYKPLYASLFILCAAVPIFLLNYIYDNEAQYYQEKGNPKARYAQIKSLSEHKISVWYDSYNGWTGNFTVVHPELLEGLKEGDIIKVGYVDGIYRAFAFNIQRYVPEVKE